MYDIIIIGAGPAGLTAAIYALRAAKKVLILEAKGYGGQIINTLDIENYPGEEHISGFDFATKLMNQVKNLGVEIQYEKALTIKKQNDFFEVETTKQSYQGKTVILATGTNTKKLGLPREEELLGKGISYCATCDGAFYKNKIVAVVGGGNTALEDAYYLSDLAEKVYLIHRRDEFRGDRKTLDRLKGKNNVEIIYQSIVTKLNGSSKLEGIELMNQDNNTISLDVDGLFIAIGRNPENDIVKDIVTLDENNYIVADENGKTNQDGIFAAGDNRQKELRQLVTATADGAIAAVEAIKYINNRR